MKKIAIISALIMLTACVIFIVGCAPEEEEAKLSSYQINAVLDTENMTVAAEETVKYVNNNEVTLDSVYFHLYPAAYREGARFSPVETRYHEEAYPNGMSYGGIEINSVSVNGETAVYEIGGQDEDILIVNTAALEPTDEVEIKIGFDLTIPQIRHRFGYLNNVVNLGNWYPVAAIYENGGWRTDPYYSVGDPFYSEVADYNVSITTPAGWIISGPGTVSASIDGGETTTVFNAEKVRDFAMVAGENMFMDEAKAGDVTLRYYYVSDPKAEYRMKLIKDSLNTFNDLFGAYPYAQLSVVQTNFQQGGMEYPQIVYISNALNESLYDEAIIHEIAHQWWYGVVGNDEINSAWMDEGLTEYSTSVFYEKNPSYGVDFDDRIADAMKGYVLFNEVYEVQIAGDTSMNRPLNEYFSSIDYAYHTYVKGELMFDSVRHLIGDEPFFTALRTYYSGHMYKIAKPDDMIAEFEKASKMNLKTLFTNWLEGNVGLYASVIL